MSFAIDGVRTPSPKPAALETFPARPLAVVVDGSSQTAQTAQTAQSPQDSRFARVLSGLGKAVRDGERTMDRVRDAGRADLGAGELLALQSEVYRYSEAVDLSAKLVDRVTNGVKTVIQGQ